MLRQLGADHHVAFKCLGTNLEFFHKLRPNLLFGDIWAELGKRLRQLLCERPCCPTACAIGARRVIAVFIRLNKDLRGKPLSRSSRTKKKKIQKQKKGLGLLFLLDFF